MNNLTPNPSDQPKESLWYRLQRGQALVEYWPTIPVGIMVMISAAAIVAPVKQIFQTTADSLNGISCEAAPEVGPTAVDLDGGHRIEVVSSNYNGESTTVVFKVSSGDKPAISHWVLGIDEELADRIIDSNWTYERMYDKPDPTTGQYGIKFDQGYGEGGGSDEGGKGGKGGGGKEPKSKSRVINSYRPRAVVYVEEREIVLTLTGRVDFVETLPVTTKAGATQVSTGYVTVPSLGSTEGSGDC